jgi:hypothetical protein
MDSADPRTQPASQSQQQPHHHHAQQHHPQQQPQQQRQPQQPLNDQQQQPHHIPQQLTQPQSLHQQQQITHPPQHAQQSQPTGYALPQHNYTHQIQMGHAYHPQAYSPRQFTSYSTGLPAYPYSGYGPPYSQHSWQQQPPFQAVPVSTPTVQSPPSALKATHQTLPVREKRKVPIIDPKTRKEVDLTDLEEPEKSSSNAKENSTKENTTTATTPTKSTPTQQPKSAATATTATTVTKSTPVKTQTTENSAVPVNANITNNNVTNSSSSDRAGTSSPSISVSNILLQKVSEDSNSDKREEVAATVTTPIVVSKATVSPLPAKVVATTEPPTSLPAVTTTAIKSDSEEVPKVEEKSEVSSVTPVVNSVEQSDGDKKLDDKVVVEDCDEETTKKDADANGEIKLHYEEGQYNPTSDRNGKKKYSRQFMLDVCEKICKLDINSEVSSDSGMTSYTLDKSHDPFTPSFHQSKYPSTNRQNDSARRQNPNNYTGRSSAGQERQRKIIVPSSSLTNEVELKTVSNPWRPGKEVKEEEAPVDVVEVEVLKKKFRSILNKLTPQNFDNLAIAVTDLNIDTEAKLGEVIDIVFAKALAEPGYCVTYGQMCSHLKKITAGAANFGNTLLKR